MQRSEKVTAIVDWLPNKGESFNHSAIQTANAESPLRDVSSIVTSATKNLASLYFIPGARLSYSRHPPFRRTRPSAVVTPTMSKVRLSFMVNRIRRLDSLLAESSISARASTFMSGDGLPFEAKLVTSIQVPPAYNLAKHFG